MERDVQARRWGWGEGLQRRGASEEREGGSRGVRRREGTAVKVSVCSQRRVGWGKDCGCWGERWY